MTEPTEAEVERDAMINKRIDNILLDGRQGIWTSMEGGSLRIKEDALRACLEMEMTAAYEAGRTAAAQVRERAGQGEIKALVVAALPFAVHDWMDAELEDNSCKLTKHSGPITVGHWRALRAALAPLATEEYFIKRPATHDLGPLPIYGATEDIAENKREIRTMHAVDEDQGEDVLGMRKGEE